VHGQRLHALGPEAWSLYIASASDPHEFRQELIGIRAVLKNVKRNHVAKCFVAERQLFPLSYDKRSIDHGATTYALPIL